jgi:hypothetical protein
MGELKGWVEAFYSGAEAVCTDFRPNGFRRLSEPFSLPNRLFGAGTMLGSSSAADVCG